MRRTDRYASQQRAAYPDDPRVAGRENTARPGARPYDAPDPLSGGEPYFYGDSAPYPDAAYAPNQTQQQSAPRPMRPAPQRAPARRRGGRSGLWALIALLSLAAIAGMIAYIANAYGAYAPFRARVNATKESTYCEGVIVDGIALGGMTRAEALAALSSSAENASKQLQITIRVDNSSFLLTETAVPFQRNIEAVLDTAYAIGRSNSVQVLGSSVTPFEWRYAHRLATQQNKAYLYTKVDYDKADVRTFVSGVASYVNVAAADAMVATFDFNTRSFTFTDEVIGATLNEEALYQAILDQLDAGAYNATIQTATTSIMPSVTRVELMNTFVQVAAYTTETTAVYNRNVNIALAAQAVNGMVVDAGETFSFNQTTGQRTAAKGYLEAAAIAGGTTTEEIGGGVCQVSSTLFNAAMMADLTLVSRSPHTWPSTYVDPGRDATVNWPNLDFKFKNQRETPIFIVCYFTQGKSMSSKGKLTVEIYGVSLGAGVTVTLKTELTSTEKPPADPIYQRNTALEPGTEQELKKARTGYVYETYKVYQRNGVEYNRAWLCTSTYRMIQQVIEYN